MSEFLPTLARSANPLNGNLGGAGLSIVLSRAGVSRRAIGHTPIQLNRQEKQECRKAGSPP